MRTHRLISIVVLCTFLTSTVGCSKSTTVRIDSDPASSSSAAKLHSGERVEIFGYTRPDDGYRDWKGFVTSVPPDSLAFESKPARSSPSVSFRIAQTDAVSIDARTFSPVRTTALSIVTVLVVGVVAAGIAFAMNPPMSGSGF